MPKNPLTELNEIFVKSQRLTAQQSDAGSTSRHLNRGVSELGEASRSLASRADSLAFGGLAEDPHSRKIFNEVNAITLTNAQDAVSLEGTDLEGYLAHHHDMILLTAIEESRQISDNYLYQIQQSAVLQEWENARTQFIETLGHRSHKWTPGVTNSTAHSAVDVDHQSLLEYNPVGSSKVAFDASFIGSPRLNNNLQSSLTQEPLLSSERPTLPKIIATHADCVRKISTHQSQSLSSRNENIHPCKLLLSSLKETAGEGRNLANTQNILSNKDVVGYRSLLSLLASMTGENRYGSEVIPGYFATICCDPSTVDLVVLKEKKSKLTKGAQLFFEDQIMLAWDHKIEEAIQLNELDLSSRTQGRTVRVKLQKLIQYEYRNHMIPPQSKLVDLTITNVGGTAVPTILKNIPIWALVYYYLRSGNIDLAVQELQDLYMQLHWEEMYSVLCVLKAYVGETNDYRELRSPRGGGGGGFSTPRHSSFGNLGNSNAIQALSAGDAEVVETAIKQCKLHYQRESLKEEQHIDPYYLFILNLVALIDYRDLNGSLIPNFSFEDFLWSHLWFISTSRLLNDLLSNAGTTSTSSHLLGTHSPFNRKPAAIAVETTSEENELLELVYAYGGANYFDHDGQSPYKYALLLCCCHRFGDALTYLWMSGKSFSATHLLMISLYYGLVLPHVPLLQNPVHPLVTSDYHHYHQLSHSSSSASNALTAASISNVFHLTPAHILQLFLNNQLFQSYPEYCLDYYLLLQTKWMESVSYQSEEILKLQLFKFDDLLIDRLTQFLLSLTNHQLTIILGKPTLTVLDETATEVAAAAAAAAAGGVGVAAKLANREYRSKGYLDNYLKQDKILILCNKVIYYYYSVEKDLEKVIHYYELLGGYPEILSIFSQELVKYWIIDPQPFASSSSSTSTSGSVGGRGVGGGGVSGLTIYSINLKENADALAIGNSTWNPLLLQKRKQRDAWRGKAEQFMKIILHLTQQLDKQKNEGNPASSIGFSTSTNVLHVLNISIETFNNFHLLMILYQVIDEVTIHHSYERALLLLELNHLFPSIDHYESSSSHENNRSEGILFFLNPILKQVIDDLLLVIITSLFEWMREYQTNSSSTNNASSFLQSSGSRSSDRRTTGKQDTTKEYLNMERRYQQVTDYLAKFKDQLNKKQIILQEYQRLQSFMTLH